jgi:hypothetical protein
MHVTVSHAVAQIWGGSLTQVPPEFYYQPSPGRRNFIGIPSSEINLDIFLDYRRKGLLWFSTYTADFKSEYTISNPMPEEEEFFFTFYLPEEGGVFTDFAMLVDGIPFEEDQDFSDGITWQGKLKPKEEKVIAVKYTGRGTGRWVYRLGKRERQRIPDFKLAVNTNFKDFDFPTGAMSPTDKVETPEGWQLKWDFTNLITRFDVGVILPEPLNPGWVVTRLIFMAPLSLLLFLASLVILVLIRELSLHPFHFVFICAAYFSFHLLLAYLASYMPLSLALILSFLVTFFLIINYLRLISNWRFSLEGGGFPLVMFLFLFSLAFLFPEYTGLIITVGAIIVLGALMQLTARVDWSKVLGKIF